MKKMTAKIREYYELVEGCRWKCSICSRVINGRNTSNMKQHLERHPSAFKEFREQEPLKPPSSTRYPELIGSSHSQSASYSEEEESEGFGEESMNNAEEGRSPPPEGGESCTIKDYYDQLEKTKYQCSVCQAQVKATNSSHLHTHFKTHGKVYKEFLLKRCHITAIARGGKRAKLAKQSYASEYTTKEEALDDNDEEDFDWPDEHQTEFKDVLELKSPTAHLPSSSAVSSSASREQQGTSEKDRNALKLFFDTMYETVKEMPKPEVFNLRRKIFEAVSEAEERVHLLGNAAQEGGSGI